MVTYLIETRIEKIDDRLQFTCTGKRSYAAYVELIDLISRELAKNSEIKKVLINLNELTGDLSIFERHQVGKYLAGKVPNISVAVVSPKEYLKQVIENAAVNRGAKMFSTFSLEDALAWLQQ